MATSIYFNKFSHSGEQDLIMDLVVEAIKIFGIDMYYLPRTFVNEDNLYGEDNLSEYNLAIPIEMYVRNVEGFGGQGEFYSKFNIQINDTITFTVAKRTYDELIGTVTSKTRPNESDLLWFPLTNKLYQIKFVEHEAVFYQFGTIQMYDMKCELFEYSGERINTGIDEIDSRAVEVSLNLDIYDILTSDGLVLTTSDGFPIIQSGFDLEDQAGGQIGTNDEIQTEAEEFLVFEEGNPFAERNY